MYLKNIKFTNISDEYQLCEFMGADSKRAEVYVIVSITNDMLRNNNDMCCRKSDEGEKRSKYEICFLKIASKSKIYL